MDRNEEVFFFVTFDSTERTVSLVSKQLNYRVGWLETPVYYTSECEIRMQEKLELLKLNDKTVIC